MSSKIWREYLLFFLIKITTNLFWNNIENHIAQPIPNCIPSFTHVSSVERGLLLKIKGFRGKQRAEGTVETREEAGPARGAAERAETPKWGQPQKGALPGEVGAFL